MSKNAIEQIRLQVLCLEELVDSFNDASSEHFTLGSRITLIQEKVDLLGQFVNDSVA